MRSRKFQEICIKHEFTHATILRLKILQYFERAAALVLNSIHYYVIHEARKC